MTYTVFVEDVATYVSTSLDHAKELADPYIGLGRCVAIRHYDDELPPAGWRYDFDRYEWIELARSAPRAESFDTMPAVPFGASKA